MRKTNPLHLFTFGLHRTAGPYKGAIAKPSSVDVRDPLAFVLEEGTAGDVRPYAAAKKQQSETQSEYLYVRHSETPCWASIAHGRFFKTAEAGVGVLGSTIGCGAKMVAEVMINALSSELTDQFRVRCWLRQGRRP
jgi:hypothetical protein